MDPGWLCEWVYDQTGNETLAKLSDWLVGTPLTVLCIVVGAWILAHLTRRYLGTRRQWRDDAPARLLAGEVSSAGSGSASGERARPPARGPCGSRSPASSAARPAVIIWVIALITVLGELGIDLGPLIAGAGIAGVALGFGAQSIVKDFLAGLFVLIEDQYGIGDIVDLGEAVGNRARDHVARATVLRAQDGTVWHVPNGEVMRVGNKSQIYSVAIVDVTVAYSSDIDRVHRRDPAHRDGRLWVGRHGATTSSNHRICSVSRPSPPSGSPCARWSRPRPATQWALQRAFRESIKAALDEAGIEIPAQRL